MRLMTSTPRHAPPTAHRGGFFAPINTLSKNKLTFVLHALLTYVIIQPIAAHKPRWAPSDRAGRPGSCRWHAWVNTAPARVAALYKNRLGHRRVLTAHPPGWGKGQRRRGSLAKQPTPGAYTGVRQTGMPRQAKPTATARRSPCTTAGGNQKRFRTESVFCFLEILK